MKDEIKKQPLACGITLPEGSWTSIMDMYKRVKYTQGKKSEEFITDEAGRFQVNTSIKLTQIIDQRPSTIIIDVRIWMSETEYNHTLSLIDTRVTLHNLSARPWRIKDSAGWTITASGVEAAPAPSKPAQPSTAEK